MKDERDIRKDKGQLLQHIEYCDKEISKRLEEINEQKTQIHDCETKLKVMKDILED